MSHQEETIPVPMVTRVCVLVPKKKGETALQFLTSVRLLDYRYKIKAGDETLIVPLVRSPNEAELSQLRINVGHVTIREGEFETRDVSPRALEDALSGNIPSILLSELPKSFDIVGDIAVLELNSHLAPFENTVARGIMEVHPNVRAVFAKAGSVSGSERLRPLRYLSGENRTETTHREFGCVFRVDLSKVFFSPRLSAEHQRVAEKVEQGECVLDMFAGVGPFSILIAKKLERVEVNAIDSNLEAARLIRENARLNNVGSKIRVWPGDARDIVRQHLEDKASRVIMNHPSAAKSFLDVACSALRQDGGIVHYYSFAEGEDCEKKAREELQRGFQGSHCVAQDVLETRRVREVAPLKWQVAVDAKVVRRA